MPLLRRLHDPARSVPLSSYASSTSGFGGISGKIRTERRGPNEMPVLKGESIGRYSVGKEFWFEFRRTHLTGRTVDRAKLGAVPKVLIRKTGDRLIAAYDETGRFPEQSLYFLYEACSEVSLKFLLAVLNSRLLTVYFRARCLTNRSSIAQVKKADLDRLPIPRLDLTTKHDRKSHKQILAQVDRLLRLHRESPGATRLAKITAAENAIESMVADLFGLTAQERNLVEAEFTVDKRVYHC